MLIECVKLRLVETYNAKSKVVTAVTDDSRRHNFTKEHALLRKPRRSGKEK
jgi:Tfp pilus assembly major pilin PilA